MVKRNSRTGRGIDVTTTAGCCANRGAANKLPSNTVMPTGGRNKRSDFEISAGPSIWYMTLAGPRSVMVSCRAQLLPSSLLIICSSNISDIISSSRNRCQTGLIPSETSTTTFASRTGSIPSEEGAVWNRRVTLAGPSSVIQIPQETCLK